MEFYEQGNLYEQLTSRKVEQGTKYALEVRSEADLSPSVRKCGSHLNLSCDVNLRVQEADIIRIFLCSCRGVAHLVRRTPLHIVPQKT